MLEKVKQNKKMEIKRKWNSLKQINVISKVKLKIFKYITHIKVQTMSLLLFGYCYVVYSSFCFFLTEQAFSLSFVFEVTLQLSCLCCLTLWLHFCFLLFFRNCYDSLACNVPWERVTKSCWEERRGREVFSDSQEAPSSLSLCNPGTLTHVISTLFFKKETAPYVFQKFASLSKCKS